MANRGRYLRFRKEWLKLFVEETGIDLRLLTGGARRELMKQILRQQEVTCEVAWKNLGQTTE